MTTKTQFVVDTPQGEKVLFSLVQDKKKGNVYITSPKGPRLGSAESLVALLQLDSEQFVKVENANKVSLHPSRASETLSSIKHLNPEGFLYTDALKSHGLFVPIVFKVFGNLAGERFSTGNSQSGRIEIPFVDFSKDTLVIGVALGPKGLDFEKIEDHPSTLISVHFDDFSVWIIWSLFNRPAPTATVNFSHRGGTREVPIGGSQNYEIYNFFTDVKGKYSEAYFEAFPEHGVW